jgi:hypothetical protein
MLVFKKEEYLPTGLKDELIYIKDEKKLFFAVIDDKNITTSTTFSSSNIYKIITKMVNIKVTEALKKQNNEPSKVEKIIEKEKPQNVIRSIINDKTINRLIRLNNKEKIETSVGNYFINGYIMSKKRFDIKLINATKKGFERELTLNGQWLNDRSKWIYLLNDTIEISGSQNERFLMIKDDDNIISCNIIAFMI